MKEEAQEEEMGGSKAKLLFLPFFQMIISSPSTQKLLFSLHLSGHSYYQIADGFSMALRATLFFPLVFQQLSAGPRHLPFGLRCSPGSPLGFLNLGLFSLKP